MSADLIAKAPAPQLDRRPSAQAFQIDNLLVQVMTGAVRVPHFQRGLKWENIDKTALFDSIYRGYPVGTLLLWKRAAQAAHVSLGKLTIDAPARHDALFVVDGQQRLTTLAEVLLRVPPHDERVMVFDLDANKFEYLKSRPEDLAASNSKVPLFVVLDSSKLVHWLIAHPKLGEERTSQVIALGKRIREYQVPAYVVETDDEDVLRTIFHRTNSAGKKLEASDVFNALFGALSPEYPSNLEQLARGLAEVGFGRLQERDLLNALLAIKGLPLDRPFAGSMKQSDAPDAIRRSDAALRATIVFLRGQASIPHVDLLPYALPLVVLSKFFDRFPTPRMRSLLLLRRWLWRGSLAGRLTGATVGMRQHLMCVVDGKEEESVQGLLALSGPAPIEDVGSLDRFAFQTARSKLQCCALAALGPRDLESGEPIPLDDVLSFEGEDKIPFLISLTRTTEPMAHGLPNRLLHPRWPSKRLREAIARTTDDVTLASHGISRPAQTALAEGRFSDFLLLRETSLRAVVTAAFARQAEWGADDTPSLSSMIVDERDEEEP